MDCPHHDIFKDNHAHHFSVEKDHDTRIAIVETMLKSMGNKMDEITADLKIIGTRVTVTLIIGFLGVIATIYVTGV